MSIHSSRSNRTAKNCVWTITPLGWAWTLLWDCHFQWDSETQWRWKHSGNSADIFGWCSSSCGVVGLTAGHGAAVLLLKRTRRGRRRLVQPRLSSVGPSPSVFTVSATIAIESESTSSNGTLKKAAEEKGLLRWYCNCCFHGFDQLSGRKKASCRSLSRFT